MLTVVQASALTDLTTVVNARLACGITGAAQDATLTALIARASGVIAAHCGRAFGPTRYTQTFRFPGSFRTNRARDLLLLSRYPVITDATLMPGSITAGVVITSDAVAVTAAEYEVDAPRGFVRKLSGTAVSVWGGDLVSVTWPAGYGMPTSAGTYVVTLPSDVSEVCLDLVAAVYPQLGQDTAIRSETTQDVGRLDYFDRGSSMFALDDRMQERLYRHRAPAAI